MLGVAGVSSLRHLLGEPVREGPVSPLPHQELNSVLSDRRLTKKELVRFEVGQISLLAA